MKKFMDFIQEKDRDLIFNREKETEIIAQIFKDTEFYQKLEENNTGKILPVEWIKREDIYLSNFSLNMFLRSKKLMGNELDLEDFKQLWSDYTKTADYYIQVANYMLNSDDYLYGDRYKLKSDSSDQEATHKSNLIQNMKKLQNSFQGNPQNESLYVQKVGQIGMNLLELVN